MARRIPTYDVFVGNLPGDANEKNVGKLFVPFGEIQGIFVKDDNKGPHSKIAYVKYLCEPDADRACSEIHNIEIQGRTIVVKHANQFQKKKLHDGEHAPGPKKMNGYQKGDRPSDGTDDRPSVHFSNYDPPGEVMMEQVHFASPTKRTHLTDVGNAKETALITHVESPVTVWLQIVTEDNTNKIFHITEQLSALCPSGRKVNTTPDQGKVYACNFSEDSMWYRCVVRQTLGTDRYKIQYVDYGNTEEVSMSSLVEIPQSISAAKGLAQKIVLHNTIAKDLSDKQGIQHLKVLTDGQMIQLMRIRMLADGTGHYGRVLVNGQSVADNMIQAGYANKRPELGNKMRYIQGVSAMAGGDASGPQLGPPFGPPGPSLLGQMPPMMGQMDKPMMPNHHHMPPPMVMHMQDEREKELQSELTKKRRELERIRNEKDSARMEVDFMKSKMKTLQDECVAEAAKMAEESLSKRFNTVIGLASRVKQLREQFPTSKVCMLEEAIEVCQSPDRVDNSSVTSLQSVSTFLATYQAAQTEISRCKEMGELPILIASRDSARNVLYEKFSICLEELNKVPLVERTQIVQEIELRLMQVYSPYLKIHVHNCPSMENLVADFKTWKEKKDKEFADVRTATDFSQQAVQTAFQKVQDLLSVDQPNTAEKSDVDIDGLLKTYAHALQREMNSTNMEQGKDSSMVSTMITAVLQELNTEYNMLRNFGHMATEFKSLRQSIEPWLEKKPTLDELQETKKTLRTLRSKLRHKQADILDIEESGSDGELGTIRQEENEIRSQLQAALNKSEALLGDVAKLAERLFPELILQNADVGLDAYMQYGGLVKANRDIDQYTLKPGYRTDLYISTFDGQPVLVQEFHVGDSEHCSKEEFIQQVTSYHKELKTVQAVFFSKNERLAYIEYQMVEGCLLDAAVKQYTLTPQEIQTISREVVMLVSSLHSWGFVHGEVTTQSVLYDRESGKVTLLSPDFSRTVADRCLKKHTTENGLTFNLQEQQLVNQEPFGITNELYNVALIIFWLNTLNTELNIYPNGLPDTRKVKLDPSLKMMCDTLLTGNNRMKIAAAQILQLEYFTKPVTSPSPLPVSQSPQPMKSPEPPAGSQVEEAEIPDKMSIGVFKAEDVEGQDTAAVNSDTDDSWTTGSTPTTASANSRTDSPLEAVLERKDEATLENCQTSQTDLDFQVALEDVSVATTISGNAEDLDKLSNKVEDGSDVFSQAVNSPFLVDGEEKQKVEEKMPGLDTSSLSEALGSLQLNVVVCADTTTQADDINTEVDREEDTEVTGVPESVEGCAKESDPEIVCSSDSQSV